MTAPLTLTKQLTAAVMLITSISFLYPKMASAATEGNTSLVFELKPNALKNNQSSTTSPSLTIEEVADNDALVQAVRAYLESKKSPLAPYAHRIILEPGWEQAMGIIFVESNYCARAANFNCGSVGVKPGHKQWRKFQNPFDGFKAVTDLLQRPIYQKYDTCKEKIGVYVVPGSARWLNGCETVEKHMKSLVAQAEANRQAKTASAETPSLHATTKEIALAQ
jgi:hypothetical protein